jgi:hypothetical protein
LSAAGIAAAEAGVLADALLPLLLLLLAQAATVTASAAPTVAAAAILTLLLLNCVSSMVKAETGQ